MLTIRLQRTGKKNQADFRIVLAEKAAPVSKKFTEVLGSYNPRKKNFQVKEERVKYWISQRIQISPTVHNLFVTKGLLNVAKVKAFNTPKKPVEPPAAAATPVASADQPAQAPTDQAASDANQTPAPEVAAKPETAAAEKAENPTPEQPAA